MGEERDATASYEAREMVASGTELYRGKLVSRPLAIALGAFSLAFVAAGVVGIFAESSMWAALPPLLLAALFAYGALGRSVVRTLVTSEEVLVKWGLRGPRIPIERISSCEIVPYKRSHTDGAKNYSPGVGFTEGEAQCVRLEWTDDGGKAVKAVIGDADPAALASSIQKARQARTGVRIAAGDVTTDAAAEAEALAIDEAEAADLSASSIRTTR